jgi:hypothetical protein
VQRKRVLSEGNFVEIILLCQPSSIRDKNDGGRLEKWTAALRPGELQTNPKAESTKKKQKVLSLRG